MGIPPSCIHVEDQAEYSRLQDHALHLVGPDWRSPLRAVKTGETITGDHYRTQSRRLSKALKDKRLQYNERNDKVICSTKILDPK